MWAKVRGKKWTNDFGICGAKSQTNYGASNTLTQIKLKPPNSIPKIEVLPT